MGSVYKFRPLLGSDIANNIPVTYQGNVIGSATSTPSGMLITVDEMYASSFESMIYPNIRSFSLEVITSEKI